MSTIRETIDQTEKKFTTQLTLVVKEADTASYSEDLGWETLEDVKTVKKSLLEIQKISSIQKPIDVKSIRKNINDIEVKFPDPKFKESLEFTKRVLEILEQYDEKYDLKNPENSDQLKKVSKVVFSKIDGMIGDHIKDLKSLEKQLEREREYKNQRQNNESINENYITQKNMLNVEALPYELSQLMKEYRASKEAYNSVGTNSMVMFYTPEEKEDFKQFLQAKGINFEEIGDKDDEGGEERFKR